VQYFLGAHRPNWLEQSTHSLFVSHRTLHDRKKLPRARAPWALDSGGFSELSMHGSWHTTAMEYALCAQRYQDEIGALEFASQQDWMCEAMVLAKTGLTVLEHQRRTIDNYLELMHIAPDVPWMPVLQGWARYDYGRHIEQWYARGVDLSALPRVGVGTICRRSSSLSSALILADVASYGLSLHAFGLKVDGLLAAGGHLASADSMAWSFQARRENREAGWRLAGRKTGGQNDLGCAIAWYEQRIAPILSTGFCQSSGCSLRFLDEDPHSQLEMGF
jgi:hypothetical protein